MWQPGSVIEYLVLGGAALGALGWERLRRARHARMHRAFLATLDDEAQVVLHVALREAEARHQPLRPLHLVYGLAQDEAFVAAIRRVGGDPDAIEQHVLAELDHEPADERAAHEAHEALVVMAYASAIGQHNQRRATCADIWSRLAQTTTAAVVEPGAVDPLALQFVLVHGTEPPAPMLAGAAAVHVVLRNDDVTTRDLVVEILRDVFGLPELDAERVMMTAHDEGRAIIGRFDSAVARDRIEAARARARAERSPLWLGVEAC